MILICGITGVPVKVAEERVDELLRLGYKLPEEPKEKPAPRRSKAKPKAE